jgi:hypothetical protein
MSERATKPDRMDVLRRFQRWQEDDRGGYDQLIGLACEMAEVLRVEPSADPALPLSVDERTRLHRLLQHAYSVIDPDAEPKLFEAIYAELKDCPDDQCVPPAEGAIEVFTQGDPPPGSAEDIEAHPWKADLALPPELREQTDQGDGLLGNAGVGNPTGPPSTSWIQCPICRQQNSFGGGHWAWHQFCRAELNPIALVEWMDGVALTPEVKRIMQYVVAVTGMDVAAARAALATGGG